MTSNSWKFYVKRLLAAMGTLCPLPVVRWVARKHPRLSYLLIHKGDFIIQDYLGEFSVHIDGKYVIEREMFSGQYEPRCLEAIRAQVKPGDICIDVGANVGAVALALARRVGRTGRVFCLEPGPKNFERLKMNFALNPQLEQVGFHRLGLARKQEKRLWGEDQKNPGNGGFFSQLTTEVDVTTLDAFVDDRGLRRLDFIKIDTEGMEYEILQGAQGTLQKFRPRILLETLMEFEDQLKLPIRKYCETLLKGLGYRLFCFEQSELREVQYPNFPSNVIAIANA